MKVENYFLVYSPGNIPRVTRRRPTLKASEVAYRIQFKIPDSWAKVQENALVIQLPEAAELEAL